MAKTTHTKGAWRIVLDSDEIIPNNPGEGTPAMVYGRANGMNVSGTFACVLDTGECDGQPVPDSIYQWLDSMAAAVDGFLETYSGQAHQYR